jgi:growth factor-regulated tyrosine kinase substrate
VIYAHHSWFQLTDVCIKNGGNHFLTEVASREFMDNLVSILKMPTLNIDVKNKILRLIQNWSIAFEAKASLNYVGQVYKTLNQDGEQQLGSSFQQLTFAVSRVQFPTTRFGSRQLCNG